MIQRLNLIPLYRTSILVWVLSSLILASCNDSSTSVGDDFLDENIEIHQITLQASDFSVASGIAGVSNSSNEGNDAILVGTAPDGTTAHALLNLVAFSPRLNNIQSSQIQKVELRLRSINYQSGNSAARRSAFDLVSFDGTFGSSAQWTDELVARIQNGTLLGSYNSTYPDSTFLYLTLDKDAASTFLNGYYSVDSSGVSPITETKLSLALRASDQEQTISAFLGAFLSSASSGYADTLRPTLIVTLADTTINLQMGVSNWIVDYPASIETGEGILQLAGGAPIRTHLQFSVDSIPDNALILGAEMRLFIVPGTEQTGGASGITNVVAYLAGENPRGGEKPFASFPDGTGRIFARGARPSLDTSALADHIRFTTLGSFMARWIRAERNVGAENSRTPNNGLLLALGRDLPDYEAASVDHLQFYGPDGPEGLRPELKITYSVQKSK